MTPSAYTSVTNWSIRWTAIWDCTPSLARKILHDSELLPLAPFFDILRYIGSTTTQSTPKIQLSRRVNVLETVSLYIVINETNSAHTWKHSFQIWIALILRAKVNHVLARLFCIMSFGNNCNAFLEEANDLWLCHAWLTNVLLDEYQVGAKHLFVFSL